MTTRVAVDNFLSSRNFAVVGVSRKSTKFGNAAYRELKKRGMNVYGVNSHLDMIEGDKCYKNLKELEGKIDAVINVVPPAQTVEIVKEANSIGVKNFWMQQGSESEEAITFCRENGINEVHKECILMYAEPVGSIHKVHKWIWKMIGKSPV